MPQPEDTAPYHAFVASLRAAWSKENRPLEAHLDITYRCDLDCQHCYLDNRTNWPEMTTAEWLNVLEQLQAAGVMFLVWSGGDVIMRSDFGTLLDRAAALGLMSRVKTHGGQLTAEWAQRFARDKVGRVDISVYSLRPEIHDRLTRRPGSLVNTLRGIAAAREAGIPVKISCYVQPSTISEIGEICRYFEDMGCKIVFNTNTVLDHSASETLAYLQLTDDDLVRARVEILRAQPSGLPKRLSELPSHAPCAAGRTALYISPDGELWPCVNFPMALGNLREKPLLAIWRESTARASLVAWDNDQRTGCHSCAGSGMCFYCPGDAFKKTGDFRQAPATFHAATRAKMRAWEIVQGDTFSADDWQSVPAEEAKPLTRKNFHFPIHRAKRGSGKRVGP